MAPYAEGLVSEQRRPDIVDSPRDAEDLGELIRRVDFPGVLIKLDVTLEEVDAVIGEAELETKIDGVLEAAGPQGSFWLEIHFLDGNAATEKAARSEQQPQAVALAPKPYYYDGTYATASDAEKNYLDQLREWERVKAAHPHSYVPMPHRTDEPFRLYSAI